jgi:cysteinyl-tRNA synthetase, unknown class
MSLTQVLLLLLLLLAVAAFAYALGRNSGAGRSTETPTRPVASPPTASTTGTGPQAPARPPVARPPVQSTTDPASADRPLQVPRSKPAASSAALAIASWGYQLQKLDLRHAAESPFDLLVIDYTKEGDDESALTPAELARLKQKPDGSQRRVVAYLSIGEAESYRGYWQPSWKRTKPTWLLKENPEWKENYAVSFWDPGWQSIMCGNPQARLDRILAAGFDGVYLDKCDVYEDMRSRHMPEANARPDLEADMVAFITRLSGYAKARNPNFLVIMQNTESLLDRKELRRVLDGVAKEELVYGVDSPEKKNSREDFEFSRAQLDLMKRDGKFVLVVEYLSSAAKIEDATRAIQPLGYTLFISPKNRELDKLPYDQPMV